MNFFDLINIVQNNTQSYKYSIVSMMCELMLIKLIWKDHEEAL